MKFYLQPILSNRAVNKLLLQKLQITYSSPPNPQLSFAKHHLIHPNRTFNMQLQIILLLSHDKYTLIEQSVTIDQQLVLSSQKILLIKFLHYILVILNQITAIQPAHKKFSKFCPVFLIT